MPPLRIAHLSDLHCNSTREWDAGFDEIVTCLAASRPRPRILFITGDCVEHPTRKNFRSLKENFAKLYHELERDTSEKFFVVTIPGNHDRYYFGNRFGIRSQRFEKFLTHLIYPKGYVNCQRLIDEIFRTLQIAIFPMDSTGTNRKVSFARGRANNPKRLFDDLEASFRQSAAALGISYSSCLKVALLHHHVLPLPATLNEERLEPYTLVENPYELLHALKQHAIDLVLNGHRHVSGISLTRVLPGRDHATLFSACGSAGKGDERHLNIIDFSPSMASTLTPFSATARRRSFEPSSPIPLIPYSDIRRRRYSDPSLYKDTGSEIVERATRKSKVLHILEDKDNEALVRINVDEIGWRSGRDWKDLFLKELVQADIGRVIRVACALDAGRPTQCREFEREAFALQLARTEAPERLELEMKPDQYLNPSASAYCELAYTLYNGYALTASEHEDCYPWPANKPRKEASRLRVSYPTDTMELIVKFPRQHFPDPSTVHVDPYLEKEQAAPDLANLWGEYEDRFHEEEKEYLDRHHAIQIRPDISEIAFHVRFPQPNVVYNLRWSPPRDSSAATLVSAEQAELDRLRALFASRGHEKLSGFYRNVTDLLTRILKDEKLEYLVIGYKRTCALLIVSAGPERFLQAKGLCVGRGVSGHAFKIRKPTYYEKHASFHYLERIIDDFDPYAIMAFPLLYPRCRIKKGSLKDRAFGVLCLVSYETASPLAKFKPGFWKDEERNTHLEDFYGLIDSAAEAAVTS